MSTWIWSKKRYHALVSFVRRVTCSTKGIHVRGFHDAHCSLLDSFSPSSLLVTRALKAYDEGATGAISVAIGESTESSSGEGAHDRHVGGIPADAPLHLRASVEGDGAWR